MLISSVTILRLVSFGEGVSYLVLLYFAIYHKRMLGEEEAIRVPGMVHGVLFVIFCIALVHTWLDRGWTFKKVAFAFVCALLPFAAFYLERELRVENRVNGR